MSKHYRKQNDCLNCGATVQSKFCSNCGQENLDLHEPFWHFISHSIGHYFHFDSKFFNTIVPLLTKPGFVTIEYIAGRRTRYLQPVSMYIFVSIIYFLIISLVAPNKSVNGISIKQEQSLSEKKTKKNKKAKEKELLLISRVDSFKVLSLNNQKLKLDSLQKLNNDNDEYFEKIEKIYSLKVDTTYQAYLNRQNNLPKEKKDNFLKRAFIKKSFSENLDITEFNLDHFVKKYGSKIYFLIMPLFAFFLMLSFRRNKKLYIHHLIFTIHLFTAFFLLQIVTEPLINLFSFIKGIIELIELVLVTWYIYKSARLVYGRSRWVTIGKMIALLSLLGISSLISYGLTAIVAILLA